MSGSKSGRTKNSPQQPAGNSAAPAPLRKRHMQANAYRPENTVTDLRYFLLLSSVNINPYRQYKNKSFYNVLPK